MAYSLFQCRKQISDTLSFVRNYQTMSKEEVKHKAAKLAETYSKEISSREDFVQKINHITMVYSANFDLKQLVALELLNALAEYRLESIFPNLSVSLRMFLTAPATVALTRSSSKIISGSPWVRIA